MKTTDHLRARRLGSAMGRLAPGYRNDVPAEVFGHAVTLVRSRNLVRNSATNALSFADAFLVAWLRQRGRRAEAKLIRRGIAGYLPLAAAVDTGRIPGTRLDLVLTVDGDEERPGPILTADMEEVPCEGSGR